VNLPIGQAVPRRAIASTGAPATLARLRGRWPAAKHAKTHLLIDGYLIAHGCESIRERLRHVCSPPGADDLEGVRPIFERVPDDKRSLVSLIEETRSSAIAVTSTPTSSRPSTRSACRP
jgi:hypothetical protein